LPDISEERSPTHPGKNSVSFNVEFSGLDLYFQELNFHRGRLVLIRQPSIMLGRTGKHMSNAAGAALDMLAAQFVLPE
jgi:hypothetical protein